MKEFTKLSKDDNDIITEGIEEFREGYCKSENLPIDMQNINTTADYIKDCIDQKLFGQGDKLDIWILYLGFHFGDLLVNEFSGKWMIQKDFNQLCVVIDGSFSCYPLNMVRKFFNYGDEDNLYLKYKFIKGIFDETF